MLRRKKLSLNEVENLNKKLKTSKNTTQKIEKSLEKRRKQLDQVTIELSDAKSKLKEKETKIKYPLRKQKLTLNRPGFLESSTAGGGADSAPLCNFHI